LTLAFLPALYAIWFRVKDVNARQTAQSNKTELAVGVASLEITK